MPGAPWAPPGLLRWDVCPSQVVSLSRWAQDTPEAGLVGCFTNTTSQGHQQHEKLMRNEIFVHCAWLN